LADTVSLSTSLLSIEEIALKIEEAIRVSKLRRTNDVVVQDYVETHVTPITHAMLTRRLRSNQS